MAEHLIEKDPNNASTYKANLKKAHKALDNLTKKVKSELKKILNLLSSMTPTSISRKDLM